MHFIATKDKKIQNNIKRIPVLKKSILLYSIAFIQGAAKKASEFIEGPVWMKTIAQLAQNWSKTLRNDLPQMKRSSENIRDPLFRCFAREVKFGASILAIVKRDLSDLIEICKGTRKQTNYHRLLVDNLVRGVIPTSWKCYVVPNNCTVNQVYF